MPRKKGSAGRPGGLDEARELVALVASLSEAGDALTAEAVSSRLGVSAERAEKLVALVLTASGSDGARLPLVEEAGEVTMLLTRGMRGRAVRLTRDETVALEAALERLGVSADDPLRKRVEGALDPSSLDASLVRRLVASERDPLLAEAISTCARALAERHGLRLSYLRDGSDRPEIRHVSPRRLRCEDETWYLEAYDLDRAGERTFRLDRMRELEVSAEARRVPSDAGASPAHMVQITFDDSRLLDALPWHELAVLEQDDEHAVAETPFYGGQWLVRMVAACGGSAHVDDPGLAALVTDYARTQLDL